MFKAEPLHTRWNEHSAWYWMDSSPFKSHFLNALSLSLPGCERFFIRTVKPLSTQVSPGLRPLVREFVKQESHHQAVHTRYNSWLQSNGLPVDRALMAIDRGWHRTESLSLKWRLALTVCIEHITVICTSVLLSNPHLLDQMDPQFRAVWQWHAVEELEHRAVTMDVWNELYADPWALRLAMMITLPAYMWYVGSHTILFLGTEGHLCLGRTWRDGWSFLVGEGGIISGSWAQWLDIFRRDFHPDMHDHSALERIPKLI